MRQRQMGVVRDDGIVWMTKLDINTNLWRGIEEQGTQLGWVTSSTTEVLCVSQRRLQKQTNATHTEYCSALITKTHLL